MQYIVYNGSLDELDFVFCLMALSVSAEFSLMELHGGLLPKRPLGPLLIRGLFSSTLQAKQREQLIPTPGYYSLAFSHSPLSWPF